MGIVRALPAVFVTLVFGVVLGCIPGVKNHLHWNLWVIIPISGIVLGVAFGAIQFGIAYWLNLKTTGGVMLMLAAAGAIGFAATDVGFYVSSHVPVQGVEGIADGDHALRELMSFPEFMQVKLGGSTLRARPGASSDGTGVEVGAVGTTISYFVDLLGAFVATLLTIFAMASDRPFCDPCGTYKKKQGSVTVQFAANKTLMQEVFGGIKQCIRDNDGPRLLQYVGELKQKYGAQAGSVKMVLDRRQCAHCSEWTAIGKVSRKNSRGEWERVDELDFNMSWHDAATGNAST